MKKLSIALFLLLTITVSSFAGGISGNNVTARTTPAFKGSEHFTRAYPKATEVECKFKGHFTEVSFIWNGLRLVAYYDTDGNPIATSRSVLFSSLPLSVQISLKKYYPGYVTTEAVEFNDESDGLSYYITVTGPEKTYLLQVSADGNISVFKKMKH
jgi:hypothetical protein